MQAASPSYTSQATPSAQVVHEVSCCEKWFQIGRVGSYIVGSVLFLLGSILFYPKYAVMWNGQGAVIGAWTFLFGCICFLLGTHGDFIDIVRNNSGTPLRRVINAYNGTMYVGAAAVFQLGAIYFLPDYYVKSPSLGCYAFIVGCVMFCYASFIDLVFILFTSSDNQSRGLQLRNLFSWSATVALGCFFGAVFFILGSYFYLPKYIAQEDTVMATHYMNKAITFYVIGSVFFIINALAQIPGMLAGFKAGQKVAPPKEGAEYA
ncbi:hypothetical protein PINS_up011992 [Pythium insidiosum]|nr:hypothetical protein PINS_up011992 [Pythium insidiosum]